MGTFDLPEIYTLALGPSCSCVYFRQITRAHVIIITCMHATALTYGMCVVTQFREVRVWIPF